MRGSGDVSPSRLSLFVAFKPRQVILLEQRRANPSVSASMATKKEEKPVQLKAEDEYAMICSIALWLENKGFSKVLKRFLYAAQIQDDNWKEKAVNLSEVFLRPVVTNLKMWYSISKPFTEEQLVSVANANGKCEEIEGKKKKKKKAKGQELATDIADHGEKGKPVKGSDDCKDLDVVDQSTKKEKKKKKDNLTS
ncbi:uncharacterized protein LOC127245235 [Andrographis paniculata]|uniref:uncharacterized protein LOC127239823 n=1 Tax=Andrographis paniculata TaxID=175694 RepID=UPI0021E9ADA6|nr:uncharacterized protein LOC127239823 [Andrographis paniculata]XP_051121941.1 uncharacterized protein LOC127245235 [Andrographis paniculata]